MSRGTNRETDRVLTHSQVHGLLLRQAAEHRMDDGPRVPFVREFLATSDDADIDPVCMGLDRHLEADDPWCDAYVEHRLAKRKRNVIEEIDAGAPHGLRTYDRSRTSDVEPDGIGWECDGERRHVVDDTILQTKKDQ